MGTWQQEDKLNRKTELTYLIQIKVIYLGVLSTGRLWLDLWYKAQNSPFDTILFPYKLCVTEKRIYVNKLKFPIF